MDTEIGLFAMKRDMINRFIGHFQAVKIEVHHVQMSPLALANFVTYDLLNKRGGIDGEAEAPAADAPGKKKCVVALDIGTDALEPDHHRRRHGSSGSGPSRSAATTSPGP